MPKQRQPTASEAEATIRALQSDLAMARYTIISLVSPAAQKILRSYSHDVASRAEVWEWAEKAALELTEICEDVQQPTLQGHPWGAPRAPCPLCRGETTSPYERGFAIPDGMVRHLLGTYNSHQCDVFKAAMELAFDRAEDPFFRKGAKKGAAEPGS